MPTAHPLSIDAWAGRECFPGEVLKVGREDGQEPLVEGSRQDRGTAGSGSEGGGRKPHKKCGALEPSG